MTALTLHALAGKAPPPELSSALAAAASVPASARERVGEMILETLELMPEDQLDNRIVRLCRPANLDPERLAPAIKSARFLFRMGAANATSPEQLAQDLAALDRTDAAALLVPLYERALLGLREEILAASLGAHGAVLAGVEWRIDMIGSSNRGRELNMPVALMTLHLREREATKAVTIQLVPSMVKQLRDACDELLSK